MAAYEKRLKIDFIGRRIFMAIILRKWKIIFFLKKKKIELKQQIELNWREFNLKQLKWLPWNEIPCDYPSSVLELNSFEELLFAIEFL